MDREKESPPERLPFCLDDTVGEIVRASQECPGVYYIAARKQDGKFLADEYYVVEKSSPAISKEAMAYGRMPEEDSRVLLYSFAEERRGYKIIEYEIYRYQVRHGIYADGQTSLRDIAFYNMEYHPEYFGPYLKLLTLKLIIRGGMTVAKQKAGVYDKVLECAKEEFLSKGFLDASLRTIAQAAETSTGSIYTRFGDKEGLFRAIAEPVVDQFKAMFRRVQEDFHQLSEEEQRADMGQYTARHQEEMLDYIYDHFDVFRLLLDGAHGTRFSCFLDELVDIEVEYTYKYMEVIGCESVKSGLVTEEFIHIIVTAYFNGMFEVVRHNMDRAAAHRYVKMLNRYHMAGFSTVFDPQP